MRNNTFEAFLQEVHARDYMGIDDDMPDAFEAWVTELDNQELGEYAEEWGEQLVKKLIEEIPSNAWTDDGKTTVQQQLRAKWLGETNA
jgi:hypothetical protein